MVIVVTLEETAGLGLACAKGENDQLKMGNMQNATWIHGFTQALIHYTDHGS